MEILHSEIQAWNSYFGKLATSQGAEGELEYDGATAAEFTRAESMLEAKLRKMTDSLAYLYREMLTLVKRTSHELFEIDLRSVHEALENNEAEAEMKEAKEIGRAHV